MSPEECIDKLQQLIVDENELVTYKMLSKELKIHVNEAKKYLYDFLTVQNSKDDFKLYSYYFISGFILKDGVQVRKMIVVSEDNLEEMKKQFKEVTSCHIYAVNKGGVRDSSSLYNSQSWCKKWAEEHRGYSSIKHPNIVIQAPVIKKVEVNKNDVKPTSSKQSLSKPSKNEGASSLFKNAKSVEKNDASAPSKSTTSSSTDAKIQEKSNGSADSEVKDQKKSTLSSLWQKLEDKTKNAKADTSKPETKGKKGSTKAVAKNNIMSMFSKQAEKNISNPVKKTTNSTPSSENISPNFEPKVETAAKVEKLSPKVETKTVVKISSQAKSKKKTSQKKTKRNTKQGSDEESDEDFKPKKKKHRRICTMDDSSDSESESEEAKDKAQRTLLDDNVEESPEVTMNISDDNEEPIPPTPPVVSNKGRKKVWKTVHKTFQDEDGFLVSKQEKVLVSASDSDEDPIPSKKPATETKNKQDTFTYRKQASLTSFFNKR